MSLEVDLNLDGADPDQLERGNAVPAGWQLAVVDDVHADPQKEGTVVFVFRIDGGDYDGVKVYDRLYDPSDARDADAARVCENRRIIYAKRLGLIVKDPSDPAGKRYMVNVARCPGGRLDLEAAIGAEVALKLVCKSVKDETTGKWSKKDKAEVDFAGVFGRDHASVPATLFVGGAGGGDGGQQPSAAGAVAASPGGPPTKPEPPVTRDPYAYLGL